MAGSFCPPEREKCPEEDKRVDDILGDASCRCGEIADHLIETKGLDPRFRCDFIRACTIDAVRRMPTTPPEVKKVLEMAKEKGWI